MSTRWLPPRHKHAALHDNSDSQPTTRPQKDFDFAFLPEPSADRSRSGRTRAVVTSDTVNVHLMAAGGPTGKRRQRVQVACSRPRTSDLHKPLHVQINNAVSKADDSLIGLAFGSPSHPPASFCKPRIETGPLGLNPAFRHPSPSMEKTAQMQPRKWRKLGDLFKPREAVVRRDEIPPGPTIGLPTGLVVLDKSPTSQGRVLEEQKLRPIQHGLEKKSKTDLGVSERTMAQSDDGLISEPSDAGIDDASRTRRTLPKLELEIPTASLDRYSVMFRSLPAASRSSSLLARRSKALDSLDLFEDSRPTTRDKDHYMPHSATDLLTPLMPPRRLTTPPMTKSPAGSKYSLFPPTSSTPVKIVGPANTDHGSRGTGHGAGTGLKRSMTSPARLSPMRDDFAVAKPQPLNLKRTMLNEQLSTTSVLKEQIVSSPEENTASTDRDAPWSSAHSFQSSFSSATTVDEIFFDIKSLRDSKGVEDGQFVMTRPASEAVQLARTRSKHAAATARSRRPEISVSQSNNTGEQTPLRPPIPSTGLSFTSAAPTKHISVNTVYFDEAIAAVERLTSPTTTNGTEQNTSSTVALHLDGNVPSRTTSSVKMSLGNVMEKSNNHHIRAQASKTREEVGLMIPSPVREVKEDRSPTSASESAVTVQVTAATTATPQRQPPSTQNEPQIKKLVSPRIAAAKRVDRPIDDSPTIPQGPPSPRRSAIDSSPPSPRDDKPPPVPKKDAKYIPLSRYAAKNTVSRIEQAGITPTRPARANTDKSIGRNVNTALPPRSVSVLNRERSATLPLSLHPPGCPAGEAASPSSTLRGLEKSIPPPSSRANPPVTAKAEVAVARTVSLSRKQSARVLVPGPKLAARRAEAARQPAQQQQPRQPPQIPKRGEQAHEQEQKTILGQGQGHRHRRTTSKSLSKDKIMSFIRGEASDSDRERNREKEKERARLQIEKHVAVREKAKEKEREKERVKGKAREKEEEKAKLRDLPLLTQNHKYENSTGTAGGTDTAVGTSTDTTGLLDPRQWEFMDKSKWEILENKAYSPIVVQAARGHRPGLSVGVVVEEV